MPYSDESGAEKSSDHHIPDEPEDPAQHRGETYDAGGLGNLCIFPALLVFMLHGDLLTVPSLFLKPLERPAGCH